MKKFIVLILVLMMCGNVLAAEKFWPIAIDDDILIIENESTIITVGSVNLKVHRCGQVQVQEWKEIVPNKDIGTVLFLAGSNVLTLASTTNCRVAYTDRGFGYWDCEPEKKKLPDWTIKVNKATFTISGEKDEALIDLNKGVTKIKVTRAGEVKHLVPEKWVKVK